MNLRRSSVTLALFALVVIALSADATPRVLRAFATRYPAAKDSLARCTTCHGDSVPALNPYGAAVKKAALDFALTDSLDSDGDGATNKVEIDSLTAPGDSSSKPRPAPAKAKGKSSAKKK